MLALLEPSVNGKKNDLAPASSFVSFIWDATILHSGSLWFSFKDIALAFANVLVLNDVSVPLGDLPVVFLNLPAILVSGNSKVAIEVLSNSYL